MDLLSVFRTFRRHWIIATPVVVLTLIGVGYAMLVKAPDYEANARLALLPQPAAPRTAAGDLIEETELGRTVSPLSRFNDLAIVVDLIANSISVGDYRQRLEEEGASPDYQIGMDPRTAVAVFLAKAGTEEQATATLQLVFEAFEDELIEIQEEQGVDPKFMITSMTIQEPDEADAQPSSSVRLAMAIAALGLISTFGVVSIAEARRQVKEERRALKSTGGQEMPELDQEIPELDQERGEDLTRS